MWNRQVVSRITLLLLGCEYPYILAVDNSSIVKATMRLILIKHNPIFTIDREKKTFYHH
jgi:hypothetical protein